MTSRIFISYASGERKLAEAAMRQLERGGHLPSDTVFFDVQNIPAGADIRQLLKSKIEASDALVVVLTAAAAVSHWINYEVGLADALGKRIIVVTDKGPEDQRLLANLSSYQTVPLDEG